MNIAKLCQKSAQMFMDGATNGDTFAAQLIRHLKLYRAGGGDNSIIDIGKALQNMEVEHEG